MGSFFARFLYNVLWILALPLLLLQLVWKSRQNPAYRQRFFERLGRVPAQHEKPILIHCASVGEFIAAKPLINAFLNVNTPVHITCNTPTGSALIQKTYPNLSHSYLPVDIPLCCRHFLGRIQPRACVLLETEVWPSLVQACVCSNIPVSLVNARMSEKSARGYQRAAMFFSATWRQLEYVAAQTPIIAERFRTLGVPNERIEIVGNLKFDIQVPRATIRDAASLKALLGSRQVITAGSTHEGEELLILETFQRLLQCKPDALLILVPRHKERFSNVEQLLIKSELRYEKRSSGRPILPSTQVLLADTMGEMLLWYGVATIAFIGGSLIERGGHNPLEAMTFGVPITSGRYVFNFEDVFKQLDQVQAVRWVEDSITMHDTWLGLLTTPETAQRIGEQAQRMFSQHEGAAARIHAAIQQRLS